MKNRKALSMMSLCQKAGKLVSGDLSCEKVLQNGKALIIILPVDASENTKKKFINKAYFYNVMVLNVKSTSDELSSAIGKTNRYVFAVCDENFAKKIKSDFTDF